MLKEKRLAAKRRKKHKKRAFNGGGHPKLINQEMPGIEGRLDSPSTRNFSI